MRAKEKLPKLIDRIRDETYFLPHPALLDYVESINIINIDFTTENNLSSLYTFVPTHTRFLCFYLHDPVKVKKEGGDFITRARSIIIGPQLTPVMLDLGQKHHTIIVTLKPCSMYRLLGIPLEEIVDCDFDASLVIGREIDEVLDRLHEAKSNHEKNIIIQNYLLHKLQQLKPALPFDQAMVQLVGASGNLPIDYVASQSYLCVRQFERKCLERIGLPPKVYARMIRFSHAYKCKEANPNMTWIDIGHRCGYFDQMHFIRDFKSFAGFTPGMLKEEDIERSVRFRVLED